MELWQPARARAVALIGLQTRRQGPPLTLLRRSLWHALSRSPPPCASASWLPGCPSSLPPRSHGPPPMPCGSPPAPHGIPPRQHGWPAWRLSPSHRASPSLQGVVHSPAGGSGPPSRLVPLPQRQPSRQCCLISPYPASWEARQWDELQGHQLASPTSPRLLMAWTAASKPAYPPAQSHSWLVGQGVGAAARRLQPLFPPQEGRDQQLRPGRCRRALSPSPPPHPLWPPAPPSCGLLG